MVRQVKSTPKLTLSQVIEGCLLAKHAERLSEHTIADYNNAYKKLSAYFSDDPIFADLDEDALRKFMSDLGRPVAPNGIAARPAKPLSDKSIKNIHTALSALWTYAVDEEITSRHVMRKIKRPRGETRVIEPLTYDEVVAVLKACDQSKVYERPGKRLCANTRPTALRDHAIMLLLLDTGVRASELCGLNIANFDAKKGEIKVIGKGKKERLLPIDSATVAAINRYLKKKRDANENVNRPLFMSIRGDRLTRTALLDLLNSLGERAGLPRPLHPHLARHTFAVQYLRKNPNIYQLQDMLGHASLDMVRKYLHLAQVDLVAGHQLGSPVANWNLK